MDKNEIVIVNNEQVIVNSVTVMVNDEQVMVNICISAVPLFIHSLITKVFRVVRTVNVIRIIDKIHSYVHKK